MSSLRDAIAQKADAIELRIANTLADLEAAVMDTAIRVVVLHVDLVDLIGLPHLMRLRRESPVRIWVLAWNGRTPQLAGLVIRLRARGGVDLDDLAHAATAIFQVVSGQVCLPGWMLHDFYQALVDDRRRREAETSQSDDDSAEALTPREAAALELMREGLINREIGAQMQISVSTVKKHLKNALKKRGLQRRRQTLG